MRLYVALVAALTLVLGFGVAQATGNRALGGVVLVLGWVWCAWFWYRSSGPLVAVLLSLWFLLVFVISHPLGNLIGAWPAVLVVAGLAAGASYGATPRLGARPSA